MDTFFSAFFVLLFIAMGIIRMPYVRINKKADKKSCERPQTEKFLVFINVVGMMIIPMLTVFTPVFDVFRMDLPGWIRAVAAAACIADLIFFYWIHKWLGRNWSPILEIKNDHKLITDGPYKYVRHPMYTQIWIWVLLQGIVLSNWLVAIYGVIAWATLYFLRTPREERMLVEEFGEEYESYRACTGRIVPFLNII